MFGELTWTCHICKKERLDKNISVCQNPLIVNSIKIGNQNVRYCNDNIDCTERAKTFNFMRKD